MPKRTLVNAAAGAPRKNHLCALRPPKRPPGSRLRLPTSKNERRSLERSLTSQSHVIDHARGNHTLHTRGYARRARSAVEGRTGRRRSTPRKARTKMLRQDVVLWTCVVTRCCSFATAAAHNHLQTCKKAHELRALLPGTGLGPPPKCRECSSQAPIGWRVCVQSRDGLTRCAGSCNYRHPKAAAESPSCRPPSSSSGRPAPPPPSQRPAARTPPRIGP
jgi:hypothetical protein